MSNSGSRLQKTIINTATGIMNQFCNLILNFLLRTVFIYTLGIQYTGISSVFTDILTMLSLSELGIGTAIATALYKPLHDNDQDKIRKLMHFYKQAYRLIALFILLVGVALLPFLDTLITKVPDIQESIYIIFIFYIVKTAASYLLVYKATLLNADQKQYTVKILETICTSLRYITEIVLLLLFKQYLFYLVVEVIAVIIQNCIISRQVEKRYPYAFTRTDEQLSVPERRALFKDIKGLTMFRLSSSVGNSIDNILISAFISTATAGLLSNYILVRRQLENLTKQFFSAVIPSIGSLAAENNPAKQLSVFNRMFFVCFTVINFFSVSFFVLINPFISLWLGETFILDNAVAFIIAFDLFLYILLQLIASFRTANAIFVKGQYRPLITAVLNILLSVIMIQYYGIFGTILATVICRLLTQWYDPYLLYKHIFKISFKKFYLKYWYYMALFFCSCFITYKASTLLTIGHPIWNFIIKIVCCVLLPNLIVIIFNFHCSELHYVLALWTGRLNALLKYKTKGIKK